MSSSEVSNRLQEIRVDLEKAVDLMERERPGKKRQQHSISFRSYHCRLFSKLFSLLYVVLVPLLPSDEALRFLTRAQCQSPLILAETHPLQGELADATARAYATKGGFHNVHVGRLSFYGQFI